MLMCDTRKSEAKTVLRFLDWKIKGRVMPLTMMGDLGRGRREGCCRAGKDGDLLLAILSLYCSLYIPLNVTLLIALLDIL